MYDWHDLARVEKFNHLVFILLNRCILWINNQPYRLGEIELYYYCDRHRDEYVHKDPLQLVFGGLYFHRYPNGTYKNGTYKGLDLTFGGNGIRISFLVRTIENLTTREIITGPCKCVDHMLAVLGQPGISELVTKMGPISILSSNNYIYLGEQTYGNDERIWTGPRVGLSDKYPQFKLAPYRFVSDRAKAAVKKDKRSLSIFY